MSSTRATACTLAMIAMAILTSVAVTPASGQIAADPNSATVMVTGGVEFRNRYVFRGVRQHATDLAIWPFVDVGIAAFSSDGALKNVVAHVGSWNSLHTGDTGAGGPAGRLWYESDMYARVDLTLGRGVGVGTEYRTYISPNDMFSTVKEIALELAWDDRAAFGAAALSPHLLVALEVDAAPGTGQVDGGLRPGAYLEVGITPGFTARRVRVAFPVKVGLSLDDYYELAGRDHTFGYLSAGGVVTVPLGGRTRFGAWNVHGGAEYHGLGTTPTAFNDGDGATVTTSIGIGWSY